MYLSTHDEPDEYFNLPTGIRSELLDLFVRYGVTAVFSGHYHRNRSPASYRGLLHVVSSALGRPLGDDPSGLRIVKVGVSKGNKTGAADLEHTYYGLKDVPESITL